MSVEKRKRQTIMVHDESWEKYCKLKEQHFRAMGKPELSFTEFANACMRYADVNLSIILEFRIRRKPL